MRIAYYLPLDRISNHELSTLYFDWSEEKIFEKTGIKERRKASEHEYCSDMAVASAERLFENYALDRTEIDFLILVTQSPDYQLPTTACIVQNRLGLNNSIGAIDVNLGCSGYVYGLSLAKALIVSGISKKILLVTSELYTKHINKMDKSVRTLFGDAATSTLLDLQTAKQIGQFVFGTDGDNYDKLIIPESGMHLSNKELTVSRDIGSECRTNRELYMDGTGIFDFTIDVVPKSVCEVLKKNNVQKEDIDLFVFHQANKFILDYLKRILDIPDNKFYIGLEKVGNTVSSSIPLALKTAEEEGVLKKGNKVLLVGYGVGLSWGAVIIEY